MRTVIVNVFFLFCLNIFASSAGNNSDHAKFVLQSFEPKALLHNGSEFKTISPEVLKDKIAGGWAGKMIGVTYGFPSEFRFQERMKEDSIKWVPADIKGCLWQDDLYVQLSFLMAMDKYGIDAPAKKFQQLFAQSGFNLFHANMQARKNYFDSIFPPQSGRPENNLHADDIDFQIEADYIGFMSPGMPQEAIKIAEKIGHIMNYGDGVYGGIFVSSLYSEAYFENDIPKIIDKALKSIPTESDYSKIIRDVVVLHQYYPTDWKAAWKELELKWGDVDICGAASTFNIDAKLNGAYLVIGLLYGEGDPWKTLEITTRCGEDSDCNASSALAVLGVIKGFSNLPDNLKKEVNAIGDSIFIYTDYSFKKAVDRTFNYAKKLVIQNGGEVSDNEIEIKVQEPLAPDLEEAFPNTVLNKKITVFQKDGLILKGNWKVFQWIIPWEPTKKFSDQSKYADNMGDEMEITFTGTGISVTGNWYKDGGKADIYLDGKFDQTINTYFDHNKQQVEETSLWHVFGLKPGSHQLTLKVRGDKCIQSSGTRIYITDVIIYKTASKKNMGYNFSFEKH